MTTLITGERQHNDNSNHIEIDSIEALKARSAKSGIEHLIVWAFARTEIRDNKYYVANYAHRYLTEMAEIFPKVTLMSNTWHIPQNYQSQIDTDRIDVSLFKIQRGALSINPILRKSLDVNKRTVVLLQIPNPIFAFLFPYFSLRAKRLFTYAANDWRANARDKREQGKYVRSIYEPMVSDYAFRRSDAIFVRGPRLYKNAVELNDNVHITLPLTPLIGNTAFREPTDTCQNEKINLLFVGKLVPVKGVDLILEAIRIIVSRNPDLADRLHLNVVGHGDEREALEQEVYQMGWRDKVVFHGFVDDSAKLLDIYQQTDIQIVPSKHPYEGLPRVIEEGLYNSLPIIATPSGSIPDAFNDGEDIIFVPFKDSLAVADAIQRIVNDDELRQRLIHSNQSVANAIRSGATPARQHATVMLNTL